MDTPRPLARPLPPWPGVLPLAEAAAALGLKPDTLQKRVTRRAQPSLLRGGRRFVVLLPAQWATWARSYRPVTDGRTTPEGESPAPRTAPDTGTAGVLELLRQLEAAHRRERELTGLVGYWQGRCAEAEALPARPSPAARLGDSPPGPWWRRWLVWLGTPLALGAPRAPLPEK